MNPDDLARYRLAVARIVEAFTSFNIGMSETRDHINRILTEAALTRSAVDAPMWTSWADDDTTTDTDRHATTSRRAACPAVYPDLGTRCHRRGEHDRHATIDPDHPSILECVAEW